MKTKQKTNPKEVTAFARRVLNFKRENAMTWQQFADITGYNSRHTVCSVIMAAYYNGNSLSQAKMDQIAKRMEAHNVAH